MTSPATVRIDAIDLRGRPGDDRLRLTIVQYLVGGLSDANLRATIGLAADELAEMEVVAHHLAERYRIEGKAAIVDVAGGERRYDKTLLLLLGQKLAPVSIVRDRGTITIAAAISTATRGDSGTRRGWSGYESGSTNGGGGSAATHSGGGAEAARSGSSIVPAD